MTFKQYFYDVYLESREVAKNIKNRSSKEIYKVAQDIRKNPQDYPDLQIAKIIEFKYSFIDKRQDDKETFFQSAYSYYSDESFRINDVFYFIRIPSIFKVTKNQIEEFISKKFKINPKDEDQLQKVLRDNSKYSSYLIDEDPLILMAKSLLRSQPRKDFEKLDENDILTIFNYFKITTPVIYNYLIKNTFDLPKHPSEISSDYINLPYSILNKMYDENPKSNTRQLTPLILAVDSSDITGGSESNYSSYLSFTGFCRILDADATSNFSPTNKESHNWLKHISAIRGASDVKDYIIDHYQHWNFPSFLILKSLGYGDDRIEHDDVWSNMEWMFGENINISIQSWKVFRWFVHNIRSKYFTKEQNIHGPAGAQQIIKPIQKIAEICDIDLPNGIKTSVEKAFENASERVAKEFDSANATKQFDYGKDFIDTPYAKVIHNQKALRIEGDRMRHCVGSYGPSCLSGRSLIIQLPDSTAELDPATFNQYQHFGVGNSEPPEKDVNYLRDWININNQNLELK